jgi:hypothetical protein
MPILARNLKFRIEAAECIRELIEEIRLVPENGKLRVKLCGNWSATEECDEKYGKVFLILTLLLPFAVLVSSASLAESKLEATILMTARSFNMPATIDDLRALSDKPERACEGCWSEGVQAAS